MTATIKSLELRVEELEAELSDVKLERDSLEDECSDLEIQIDDLEGEKRDLEYELRQTTTLGDVVGFNDELRIERAFSGRLVVGLYRGNDKLREFSGRDLGDIVREIDHWMNNSSIRD